MVVHTPHRLGLLLCTALLAPSCTFVDLGTMSSFACGDGGVCANGMVCCGDFQCRLSCDRPSDGGSDAGPGDGGVSRVDAGTCNAATCPTGCCEGAACRTGTTAGECGRGGEACQRCSSAGDTCINGTCSGCAASCATGCCVGSTCTARAQNTCGGNGQACTDCGQTGDSCSPAGQCQCGSNLACSRGQRCSLGQCVCDSNSCPNGCCSATGQCVVAAEQNATLCGLARACTACMTPPGATCSSSTTRHAFQSPGACEVGTCTYFEQDQTCANGCADGNCTGDLCQGCLTPPAASCDGAIRKTFTSPGNCGTTGCSYAKQEFACAFGCSNGACNPDPCANVTCASPPAPSCDGNTRNSYQSPGTCAAGACRYSMQTMACALGCNAATGNCIADPCAGVTCESPPAASCFSSTVRRTYVSPGACSGGTCAYTRQDITCANGCANAQCQGDPCAGVSCTVPPPAVCSAGAVVSYGSAGSCSGGSCNYPPMNQPCPFGCANAACNPDPCSNVTCNVPPSAYCTGSTRHFFSSNGACTGGNCSYAPQEMVCSYGCTNGACNSDPCAGVGCNAPPAPVCVGNAKRTYTAGACSGGTCSYTSYNDFQCAFGCSGGQCNADPCAGVSCASPPAAVCLNSTTRRSYASPGSCSGGSCSYGFVDVGCTFGCASGVCNGDPCSGVACNTPPGPTCLSSTTRRTYAPAGTCSAGNCSYTPSDMGCTFGCASGACNGDPCSGVNCSGVPAAVCLSGTAKRTYTGGGSCSAGACGSYPYVDATCNTPPAPACSGNTLTTYTGGSCGGAGVCSYTPNPSMCTFGCNGGGTACAADPCAGVSCTQPGNVCASGTVSRQYTAAGTCSGGACGAAPYVDVTCPSPGLTCVSATLLRTYGPGTCSGPGTCGNSIADFDCGAPKQAICDGNGIRRYQAGTCSGTACSWPSTLSSCGLSRHCEYDPDTNEPYCELNNCLGPCP